MNLESKLHLILLESPTEDLWIYEDPAGGTADATGTMIINGEPHKIVWTAYGAVCQAKIDNVETGYFSDVANKLDGLGARTLLRREEDPSHLTTIITKRIERLIDSPEPNIETNSTDSSDPFDDIDDESYSRGPILWHIIDGRKVERRIIDGPDIPPEIEGYYQHETIAFPESEHESIKQQLNQRGFIYTTRVSDEYGKYQEGITYKTPWVF